MRNFTFLTMLIVLTSMGTAFCQSTTRQDPPKGSLTSGTIDSQFVYLYAISKSQNGIEHVRQANLERIRKNIADTIQAFTKEIAALKARDGSHRATVEAVTDSLTQARNDLQAAQREKDSFSFIGISLQKGTYSLIMWGIVLLLAVALAFYVYRYNQSHIVTRDTKKAIEDLQADFEQHRKKAMEKEQKLKRQLQDEINKRIG
jgi:parvulin-like peptidyl-prolyl isomerase